MASQYQTQEPLGRLIMGLEFDNWVVLFLKVFVYGIGFFLALSFIFIIVILIVSFLKSLKSTERVSTSDS